MSVYFVKVTVPNIGGRLVTKKRSRQICHKIYMGVIDKDLEKMKK